MKTLKIKKSSKMKVIDLRESKIDKILAKVHQMVRSRDYSVSDAEDCEYEELEEMLWKLVR